MICLVGDQSICGGGGADPKTTAKMETILVRPAKEVLILKGPGDRSTDPNPMGEKNIDPNRTGEKGIDPNELGERSADPHGLGK